MIKYKNNNNNNNNIKNKKNNEDHNKRVDSAAHDYVIKIYDSNRNNVSHNRSLTLYINQLQSS